MGVLPANSPGWSADSQTVYFSSNRSGRWLIWEQALSGGPAVQVTRAEGVWPRESADGKWLYFSDSQDVSIISRIPGSRGAGGLAPVTILGRANKVQSEGWAVTQNELVFHRASGRNSARGDPRAQPCHRKTSPDPGSDRGISGSC